MLTDFYPTDTTPKLKAHEAFILCPGLMYCQVRSCARGRCENTKVVL